MTPEQRADNAEKVFADHSEYVQRFLQEMYAVLVDPIGDAPGGIQDACAVLLKNARAKRDALGKANGELCTFCVGEDPYMFSETCVCGGSKTAAGQVSGMKALIQGNFLDRKRLSSSFIEEKKVLVGRAVLAERLLREQTSTKYDGEILCIQCHNIGRVRPFIQCFIHNPNLLEASQQESAEATR